MSSYLRFPTLRGQRLVFVHDDDLWSTTLDGDAPRRLTTSRAHVSHPKLSPDGRWIAYVAADEGARDAYVVDVEGGPPRRLTWDGEVASVCGWSGDGAVVVAGSADRPFFRPPFLNEVPLDGGPARSLGVGHALGWDRDLGGRTVLCRHTDDLARWKRYRGGRAGALWIDRKGNGRFERLVETGGNVACPSWVDGRVWFLADHDGAGNLWSVRPTGKDLRRETHHEGLYARHPAADGHVVVYEVGGELWRVSPDEPARPIPIALRASADQARRRFVPTPRFLQDVDLNPDGKRMALEVRGRPFSMAHFEGPVTWHGERDGVRYRLPRWTADGAALLTTSDAGGREALELRRATGEVRRYEPEGLGRPVEVRCAPKGSRVAVADHTQTLGVLDLDTGAWIRLDQARGGPITGMDWSADGRWLAWSRPEPSGDGARICLWSADDQQITEVTDGRHTDWCPSFDPDGALLWFLSRRDFDPVYDSHVFDLGFPRGARPWAVTLRADAPHPFRPQPEVIDAKPPRGRKEAPDVVVDRDGIATRLVPLPVREGVFHRLVALSGGQALVTRAGPAGALGRTWQDMGPPKADKALLLWDPTSRELVTVEDAITDFGVDLARRSAWVSVGWKLRVIPAAPDKSRREEIKKQKSAPPGRASGWVDLDRVRVSLDPRSEWRQMFHETWRLVREHFWDAGMSGVDWDAVRARYEPLVERVSTREELSDVLWCLIGELGTSHAYEMAGDLKHPPRWSPGRLAADLAWDADAGLWRFSRICVGDPGFPGRTSPLSEPGVRAAVGTGLAAVDGVELAADRPPARELVNKAGQLVTLTLVDADGARRDVVVPALRDDRAARYRDWVRANRERVHEATGGRCGYVHVPDMGPDGYADFHRDFLSESSRGGLVVDVRHNRGGHVSQLLLEKLARKPLAWTHSRWSDPRPYPALAARGPMVAVTNEYAGSDGDIFSHVWKLLGLGPLVGRRTWGGVVGIWPRHRLVDNTVTTQPEFAFWFPDVAFGVENHGTEPDVDVDIAPHDWAAGTDPQLDHALSWMVESLDRAGGS